MAIENPQTYAEWFWNNSVQAVNMKAEQVEKTLKPVVQTIVNGLPDFTDLPPAIRSYFNAISNPTAPDWDNVLVRFVADLGSGIAQRVLGHEIKEFDYKVNKYLQNTLITPDVANRLRMRNKITDDLWKARQNTGGLSEIEGAFIYESQKPYPNIADIITFARYNADPYNPRDKAFSVFDISATDWEMWDWLSWQKLNTGQVLELHKRRIWPETEVTLELARLGWQDKDRTALLDLAYSLPNAMLIVQGALLQGADDDTIIEAISKADIHPTYATAYYDAVLTKPASEDLIAYQLRKDPSLSNLDVELKKIGIHPAYNSVYKELAYEIPPVADIITMAVREAFTPEIASRFGQYEGLPPDYVQWVQKKGLTKEWAERYWAAHWSLPSPQQGFDMLHRGIIDRSELGLLLRALDIMPFWRDKLIEVAYKPLTRVDVRRMFQLGVLDRSETKQAYEDIGYNDKNAERMTVFTERYVRQTQSKFNTNDVINAYTQRLIDRGEANRLLRIIGIKDADIQGILDTANVKREWAYKKEKIEAVQNLFKKGKIQESQVQTELRQINIPSEQIALYLQQWMAKSPAEKESLWTTVQTIGFTKSGLISIQRAEQELRDLGYDDEHVRVYLASVTPQTE